MEGISNELYGGGGDVDEKTKDFTSFFPGCRGIIPSDALTNPKGGLVGIRNSLDNTGMRTAAQNLLTNQAVFTKEIEELTERIKADVNEVGIDTFFEGGATQSKWFRGGITQFGGSRTNYFGKEKGNGFKKGQDSPRFGRQLVIPLQEWIKILEKKWGNSQEGQPFISRKNLSMTVSWEETKKSKGLG